MSNAKVHDLGYRPFDGARAGVRWSMWSLGVHAVRRVFGLKRPFKYKILPLLSLVVAFVPALIFVGVAIIIPEDFRADGGIAYGDYVGTVGFAVLIFAALVAPDVICTDRRSGMLALYMASPLDRTTYIVSKAASVVAVMLTMTLLPQLFLLIANTVAGIGPGFGEFFKILGQIFASGVLLAVFFAGVSMAISSLTPRRGMATGAILLALLLPSIVVGVLTAASDSANLLTILDISSLPFAAVRRIFGFDDGGSTAMNDTSTFVVILATMAWAIGGLVFAWWRYQEIEIDR